jgi:hypothetical protein
MGEASKSPQSSFSPKTFFVTKNATPELTTAIKAIAPFINHFRTEATKRERYRFDKHLTQ